MKFLRTLLLAFVLPALLLPAGASICICDLLGGRHGMENCSTCHVTCCGHPQRNGAPTSVESVVTRDCFLHVPGSDPADGSVAKQTTANHDDATQAPSYTNAYLAFGTESHLAKSAIQGLSRAANPRAAAIPLFARALPLRL